ncbi:hypothetical protein Desaci_1404 [Desulfosporosinus acidiphilus SJ4]|uniref:Uncharacterized protein n=1 Tax=Desulfosporosinus acidiphilus (strain DSM 22704 / JCM 16185 / SJ4) TaxID=646529 RepID=I4D3Q3_DESAJ|nr:hypothetical protein [Desulfosporosinus acidiphilus]AFM40427.1 hypothetical protein Desaci_1404 [Desulfosporosinus acidiphilus SJ4]
MATLKYGSLYAIQNGYGNWNGGYLDTRGYSNTGNMLAVSTAIVWNRDQNSGIWKILSASGKNTGDPVCAGDSVYLQNQYPANPSVLGGYLDTRCGGCQGNFLCVSTAETEKRDGLSGTWLIITSNLTGQPVEESDDLWLQNEYGYDGGFLDTRCPDSDNLLCVSTSATKERDSNSTHWRFVNAKESATIDNVKSVFSNLGKQSFCHTYHKEDYLPGLIESHFKAVAAFGHKLIFTYTNIDITVGDGIYMIGDYHPCDETDNIPKVFKTDHPGWGHPCGAQSCGDFMAMGIQEDADGNNPSEIRIYDISMVQYNQPMKNIGVIKREQGVNGVAMTKEIGPDGRYIIAAKQSHLSIYRSSGPVLDATTTFDEIPGFPQDDFGGCGLGLVTQTDGTIYLFSFGGDDLSQNNHIDLFELDLQKATCTKVDTKKLDVPGFTTSFRWGKGLAVRSSNVIEFYATSRNMFPRLPFSVISSFDMAILVATG